MNTILYIYINMCLLELYIYMKVFFIKRFVVEHHTVLYS
jgi:hypothetical protein